MSPETAAPPKLSVHVLSNGVTHTVAYHPHELARGLYEEAFRAFHIPPPERAELALYLPDNTTEVNPELSVEKAGVAPDTTLILRGRGAGGGEA